MNRLLLDGLVLVGVLVALFVALASGAPNPQRPRNDRQLSFDTDTDTVDTDTGRPRGFVQRIFDMIKSLLGFESRRTVVRNDGTVVEIEPENEGFISRITKRILNIVSRILGTFTGSGSRDDIPVVPAPADDSRYRMKANEIERELVRFSKPETNIVRS